MAPSEPLADYTAISTARAAVQFVQIPTRRLLGFSPEHVDNAAQRWAHSWYAIAGAGAGSAVSGSTAKSSARLLLAQHHRSLFFRELLIPAPDHLAQ